MHESSLANGLTYLQNQTAQGLLAAVTFGLGSAVGALGGGVLYDAIGPQRLFGLCAAATVLAAGFVVLAGRATPAATDAAGAAMA